MLAFPQPPLTPFQVTLLPEQLQASPASSSGAATASLSSATHHTDEAVRAEEWAAATTMLHSILELASDCRAPQVKFASYSPERVMRSVRGIVDDERCRDLLEELQRSVRDYAQTSIATITELRRQRAASGVGDSAFVGSSPPSTVGCAAQQRNEEEEMEEEEEEDEETDSGSPAATLDAVQTLAGLVTYFERLQHGIAEVSSVWAYADQWCAVQATREIPRSIAVASTQVFSDVFRNAQGLFDVALRGYCAVLKAELAADTAALDSPSPAAAIPPTATGVAQLKSPATAADAHLSSDALALLACPQSIASLTTAHRRRLLFLFMQLTRDAQLYNARVEPVVVRLVERHFAGVAQQWWAEEVSAKRFFDLSETALRHADTVHQQFLHSGTIPLVEDAIQATLIGSVGAEVLRRDFTLLMEQEAYHTLRLSWRLLSASAHVRSAPAVVGLFREYLLECGQGVMEELVPNSAKATPAAAALVAARDRPFLAVRHLIGLLEHGSRTVESCFHESEKEFKVALHEALQTILEAYPGAFSEQLAAYQDAIMKEVETGHVPVSLAGRANKRDDATVAPSQHAQNEEQHEQNTPVLATRTAAAGHQGGAHAGDDEDALDRVDEEGELHSPLRRAKAETAVAASAPPPARLAAAEVAAAEADAVLGAAALRHAAPLPPEAAEATPVLRRIAFIYSYHPKKELFEAAYWRDFARRCLHPHRRVDVTGENAFICYLRDICGLSFTSKFEGMLTDLEASSQLTAQYRTWGEEQASPADEESAATPSHVETHLLILAQSFWPKWSAQPPRLYIPAALQRITAEVGRFYAGLFPNRHLTWQLPLSTATLRAQMTPQGPTFALTGTYTQCMALMRLDALHSRGVVAVSVAELCSELGLDGTSAEVLWSLQGLCHPRLRLVLCESKGSAGGEGDVSTTTAAAAAPSEERKTTESPAPGGTTTAAAAATATLAASDLLRLNVAFTPASSKVRIPLQTRARTTATAAMDGGGRGARTADNGGHLVEVAIVSCLKARRTVSHADLVAEVAQRLPFAVSTPMLKKAIDKMIERGFMVRGKDSTYQFSA